MRRPKSPKDVMPIKLFALRLSES